MYFIKLKQINFYKDFSEKNRILHFYESIYNTISGQNLINDSPIQYELDKESLVYVILIPSYLNTKIKNSELEFNFYRITTHSGFLVLINQYINFEEYFRSKLKAKRRKSLRSQLRKLEQSFQITYVLSQDKIDKVHCEFLLEKLKLMIEKRFNERGDVHSSISNWNFYETSLYKMLRDGKACLFVIYNEEEPIAISLNYLKQNIFFSAIASYDTNYSKFSLGNILILKKIEWCFKQSYSAFDMGYGDLKYKREWCTMVYKFQTHIFYNRNNIKKRLLAFLVSILVFVKINFRRKLKSILSLKFLVSRALKKA